MNKYTVLIAGPTWAEGAGFMCVQIEARNLGRAVRDATAKAVQQGGEAGAYNILGVIDGWPHVYTPQEAVAAAK